MNNNLIFFFISKNNNLISHKIIYTNINTLKSLIMCVRVSTTTTNVRPFCSDTLVI